MAERDAEDKALDLRLIRVINNSMKVLYASLASAIDSYGLSPTWSICREEEVCGTAPHPE
jgi:hypothetical protein